MDFERLRIDDLRILTDLPVCHSIRELARRHKVDPQNLTKRIKEIEKVLGCKLVERSKFGVSLNTQGAQIIDKLGQGLGVIDQAFKIGKNYRHTDQERVRICGRSFMVDYFLFKSFGLLQREFPKTVFDCTDLSPKLTERAARHGLLDFVLSFDDVFLGDNFVREKVGQTEWIFVVNPGHPLLGTGLRLIKEFQLIGFCYIDSNRLISHNTPMLLKIKSQPGSRAENTRYAVRMAASSDAIAYLPRISVADELENGRLTELEVADVERERRTMYAHFNIDTVSNKLKHRIIKLVGEGLG